MNAFAKSVSFLLFVLTLACLQTTQAQTENQQIRTLVAAGAFHKSGSSLPLLLVSNNQGNSWFFIRKISNHPTENYNAIISSTSCNETICSAVGSGFTQTPLLISKDRGQSWALVSNIADLPANVMQVLSAVSCTNSGCVAGGVYSSTTNKVNLPLLLTSDPNGQYWSFVTNIKDMPSNIENTELNSVSCVGGTCAAVGHYESEKAIQPLLLVSNDSGQSWAFVKKITGYLSDLKIPDLKTVNCTETTCIAAGKCSNGTIDMPLLIVSRDSGKTWSRVRNVIGLPRDLTDGTFSSIGCSKNACVVVGMYRNENTYLPLLIRSDNGKDWSIVHNIIGLPSDMIGADVSSVSCTHGFCVAAGYYGVGKGDTQYRPLLLMSNNRGHSWRFVQNIQGFPAQSAIFNAISCSENSCTTAGEYSQSPDISQPPPLVVSTDRGESWQLIQNISDFPNNLKSAEVFTLTDSLNPQPGTSPGRLAKRVRGDAL